jgi:hypothetical protein
MPAGKLSEASDVAGGGRFDQFCFHLLSQHQRLTSSQILAHSAFIILSDFGGKVSAENQTFLRFWPICGENAEKKPS